MLQAETLHSKDLRCFRLKSSCRQAEFKGVCRMDIQTYVQGYDFKPTVQSYEVLRSPDQ